MRLLLNDRINSITDTVILTEKYLSINEEIYQWHFPGNPVFPAALMVETTLQAARIFIWDKTCFKYSFCIDEIVKFKFFKVLIPGEVLNIKIDFDETVKKIEENKYIKIDVVGIVKDNKIFKGSMNLKRVNFETIHNNDECKKYLQYLQSNINQ